MITNLWCGCGCGLRIRALQATGGLAGLHVCAGCWDTKGLHIYHGYGDKPAKDLTAAIKSREQVEDELESDDSGSDSGD